MKKTIIGVGIGVAALAIMVGIYLFFGFIGWLFSDPFEIIPDREDRVSQSTLWDNCIYDSKRLFDDFNDTVGASYALEDLPSQGVREFMEFCLETSPPTQQ